MTEPMTDVDRLPRAAAVLLARLLVPPGKSPAKLPALRKDVAAVVGPLEDAAWASAVSALAAAGFAVPAATSSGKATRAARAKPVPLHLTGDGRTAARDRLGSIADAHTLPASKVAAFWKHRDPPSAATALLTRLYVPDKTWPTDAALRKFVVGVVGPIDDAEWAAAKATLLSAGYVNDPAATPSPPPEAVAKSAAADPLPLTDAGRSAALAWLGMDAVPAGLTWPAVRKAWLPAATVPPADRAAFRDDKRVLGLLLGRRLDVGPADSVAAAIEAAVCRDLGHPDARTLDELVSLVLGQRLGKPIPPLSAKQRDRQVPAAAFGLPDANPAAVRAAAVARWATEGAEPPPAAPANDLTTFAAAVNAAAAASSTGRWGDAKVFISHVHRQLADGSNLDAFKRRLVEANTAGLVTLERADLASEMNGDDVRASHAHHQAGGEFHFVIVGQGR